MKKKTLVIDGYNLTVEDVVGVARYYNRVEVWDDAIKRVEKARKYLEKVLEEKKPVYGLNTGFGAFENVPVDKENIEKLQVNLIRSHSIGVGRALPEEVVRASILIRINSVIRGHSGIRKEVVNSLLEILNKGIYPFVPSQGSVGCSGDLAPLSHIALVLIGEGEVFIEGKRHETSKVIDRIGLKPLKLSYKEGLALNNGTAVMTATGALCVYDAINLYRSADIAAAMSVEALMGTRTSFEPLIHRARPHRGQALCAENLYRLSRDSEIMLSHKDCVRVQDSYSLRCIPQVHGAVRDGVSYAYGVIATELNSTTDNPLIFPEEEKIFSGGNFHGEPVAFAMDFLSIIMAELGSISERRTAKLVDGKNSQGLPMFLVDKDKEGLNSGLMIGQYTAASLVSENKVLSHPASVDSIPTSANQEDHVSMGLIAARKGRKIIENVTAVIAIEFMTAAQALDFRKPLSPGMGTKTAYDYIRSLTDHISYDRVFYKELESIVKAVKEGHIISKLEEITGKMN